MRRVLWVLAAVLVLFGGLAVLAAIAVGLLLARILGDD